MRKVLAAILVTLFLFSGAHADGDMTLAVGPFAYDAVGCISYNYESEHMMYVDYSWGYVFMQYMGFDEMQRSKADFQLYNGAYDDWQIADACIDIWYGESSEGYGFYQGYSLEELDLRYYPACRLFTCPISDESGGGILSGALFVEDDGILFVECISYLSILEPPVLRTGVLERLTHDGRSVNAPETAEAAYAARPEAAAVSELTFGDVFSVDISGCTGYQMILDSSATVTYGDYAVSIDFFPYNDIIYLPEEIDRVYAATDTDDQQAKISYTKLVATDPWHAQLAVEGPAAGDGFATLLFNGRSNDNTFYTAGAVCANSYGTLIVDVYHLYEESWVETLQIERGRMLENISCIVPE